MKPRRIRLAAIALMLGVALTTALLGAMAVLADSSSVNGTVTVTAGSLSVQAVALPLDEVLLDGQDQETECTTSVDWGANDPTGSGSGWHVDVASSDFDSGNHVIDISETDQEFFPKLLDADITCIAGQDGANMPVSDITSYSTKLDSTGIKLLHANADKGMGDYDFDPDFKLEVPAETYAGVYTATITATITSGP